MMEMEKLANGQREVRRRTVIKGAAWSVPAIAVAAATPFAAASNNPPACPGCLKPGLGAYELAGVAASSRATLAFAAPVMLDATGCGSLIGNIFDFKPAFTFVILKATLTMSNGATYDSVIGAAPGAGVLGAVGAMPQLFTFTNVRIDTRNSATTLVPNLHPVSLSVTINTTFKWGLGAQIICPNTLTWNLPALGVSALVFGAGAVSYTGLSTS